MADSPGRGSIRGQRRRDLPVRPSPASTQQNARQRTQGDSGSRPSSIVHTSSDDFLMPNSGGSGLRAMESRFSLNEQFAASRRDYEFDDDDAESILEPAPIIGLPDNHDDTPLETPQENEDESLLDTERTARQLLQINNDPVDYYALLGLNSQGQHPPTVAQIRAAYHRLSLAFHPDKHPRSLKAAAEKHFTRLQKAYETLIEPRKRVIYDLEGEEGLQNEYQDGGCMGSGGEAERQIGVKTMESDEFRIWFINILTQRERRRLEDLVGSSGTCKLVLNAQRLFDNSPRVVKWASQDGNGLGNYEDVSSPEISIPPVLPAALQLRQSFSIPLPRLGENLRTSLSSWKENFGFAPTHNGTNENSFYRAVPTDPSAPKVTFTGAVGGDIETLIPVGIPNSDQRHLMALQSSSWSTLRSEKFQISTSLHGSFPETHGKGHNNSLGSKFQGTDFDITVGLVPVQTLKIGLGRPFVLVKDTKPFYFHFQTYFNHSVRHKPPALNVQISRSLGKNHIGYIQSSSGDFTWPDFISQRLPVLGASIWLPRGLLLPTMKIGYIWSHDGSSREFTTDEDDDMVDLDAVDSKDNHLKHHPASSLSSHDSWHIAANSSPLNTAISVTYGCDLFTQAPERPVRSRIRNNGQAVATSHRILISPPRGIRLEIEADVALHSSFGGIVRGVRRVGDFTSIGLGIGLNHQRGLYISFSWSRLGQNLILPVILVPSDHVNIQMWLTAVAIPCASYVFAEFAILRPWTSQKRTALLEQKRQQLQASVKERQNNAEQAVQLMQSLVDHRQAIERERGGLVILSAKYGVPETKAGAKNSWRPGEEADVTIAVAALVDAGQLSLPRGTYKSQIIGFWDPAPLKRKVLEVEYLFAGKKHRGACVGREGLVLPQGRHEI